MKKKYKKLLPCKKAENRQAYSRRRFFLTKAFLADTKVYEKNWYIPENNEKSRPKLVTVGLGFNKKIFKQQTYLLQVFIN